MIKAPRLPILLTVLAISSSVIAEPNEIAALRETGKAFVQIAKQALPAVVFIDVETTIEIPQYGYRYQPFQDFWGRRGQLAIPEELEPKKYSQGGQGSGFIISKDGYILTNNHVVQDADRITVTLTDERQFSAKVIGRDPKTEIALIKIDDPEDLPHLEIGDSDVLEVGEWVLAAGSPFGLSQTLTAGIVSAKGRDETNIAEYGNFIQTDAAINPGNSGGPLLDINGRVVGINTAIYTRTGGYMGIGFAIPINQAVQIKNQLLEHGKISRSMLGIYIQQVNEELAKSFGLEKTEGILISQIGEGSAAEEAGLQAGDIIIEMNGTKVGDVSDFRSRVAYTPPNTELTLSVFRSDQYKTVTVITKEMTDGETIASTGQMEKLGLSTKNLDDETARRLGYRRKTGVLITGVEKDSPAWRAKLRPGQIIVSVNRTPVENVDDFQQALADTADPTLLFLISDGTGSRFVVVTTE